MHALSVYLYSGVCAGGHCLQLHVKDSQEQKIYPGRIRSTCSAQQPVLRLVFVPALWWAIIRGGAGKMHRRVPAGMIERLHSDLLVLVLAEHE